MPVFIICLMLFSAQLAISQSNPEPFALSSGDYHLDYWSANAPAGTFPTAIRFHTTKIKDPKYGDEMDSDWLLAYNLTSRSRILGLDDLGFSFQNTSSQQADDGAYLGAALLSLSTLSRGNIHISWIGRTISPAERQYGIVLQYRLGEQGEFTTLPSQYFADIVPNASAMIPPVILPEVCNNQAIVQVRWKYYYTEVGSSGTRPNLAVDDIFVTSSVYISVNDNQQSEKRISFTDNRINLKPIAGNSQLYIIDYCGRIVYTEANFSDSNSLDISSFPNGIYIVKLLNGTNCFVEKIVKW